MSSADHLAATVGARFSSYVWESLIGERIRKT